MFKLFRRLLFLILIGVIAYQQWHIYTLEANIKTTAEKVSNDGGGVSTSLEKANYYTKEAQKFIKSGKLKEAQESLKKVENGTKDAAAKSKNIISETSKVLNKTKKTAESVLDKAQNGRAKDTEKEKK